jgi:predicted Zn-dependent protease
LAQLAEARAKKATEVVAEQQRKRRADAMATATSLLPRKKGPKSLDFTSGVLMAMGGHYTMIEALEKFNAIIVAEGKKPAGLRTFARAVAQHKRVLAAEAAAAAKEDAKVVKRFEKNLQLTLNRTFVARLCPGARGLHVCSSTPACCRALVTLTFISVCVW